ncbi:uncharacterized protein LOC115269772 [Aedes albopictus]|uniref:Uncharacterized protein n=1 Tax=Aedes albopictus TaxID=7160 RepID=A0ABM1Y872_AEDAL
MKVKLFLLVLFFGVISEVRSIGPPNRVPCGEGCGCNKPTKCPGKLVCQPGEVLADRPPFCEPTCSDDCSATKPFPLGYLVKPTCVCKPGLVRHNGVCIEPCDCPAKEEPPVTPKACGSDDVPYQNQPGGCQTCNSLPAKPPCGCPQAPAKPCPCQVTPLPCPCQGAPAPAPGGCPAPCYPPPPVAPPNPCGSCGRTV